MNYFSRLIKFFISHKSAFILALILFLALIVRIYRLPTDVGFDFDQEFAAEFAHSILTVFPVKLIGQGLSVQGLFMGPWYFYYLVPFFFLSAGSPIGGYYGSILLGLIIIVTYFLALSNIFGRKAGLLAAFLRALLFFGIFTDWSMVPSYSSELAVIITWWCLYRIWLKDDRYLSPLGFIFGMYSSFHPVLFPFYLVFIALLLLRRSIPKRHHLVLFIVFFLVPVTPLLLFEYLHKFLELKVLLSLKHGTQTEVKEINTFKEYLVLMLDLPRNFLGFPPDELFRKIIPPVFFSVLIIFITKLKCIRQSNFHLLFLLLTAVIFPVYYFLLPTHVSDYYFLGVKIILFIYFCFILGRLVKTGGAIISVVLVIVLSLLNFKLLFDWWNRDFRISLYDKESVIVQIKHRQPDNKMNVYYNIDPGQQYGLGYLERYYKIDPQGGSGAPTYRIHIPFDKSKHDMIFSSGNVGLSVER